MRENSKRTPAMFLFAVTAIALPSAYYFGIRFLILAQGREIDLYNSDVVHPFLLAGDLLANPLSIASWHLSPSFFLFPDMLVATILVAIGIPAALQPLVYSALIAASATIGGGFLVSEIAGIRRLLAIWALAAILSLLGAWAAFAGSGSLLPNVVMKIAIAFSHSGALSMSVWGLWLVILCWRGPVDRVSLGTLAVLIVVGVFSDILLVPWLSAPAILVGAIGALILNTRPLKVTTAVIAAATGAALAFEFSLNRSRAGYAAGDAWERTRLWISDLGGWLGNGSNYAILAMLAVIVAVLAFGFVRFIHVLSGRSDGVDDLIPVLVAVVVAGALTAPFFTSYLINMENLRYFLPVILFPFMCALVAAGPLLKRLGRMGPFIVTLPVVAVSAWSVAALPKTEFVGLRGYDELIACLHEEHRNAGFAGYWNAMSLLQASGRSIHMVAITDAGDLRRWNINVVWLHARADTGSNPHFDFIIVDDLDHGSIGQRFGKPAQTRQCGGRTIWLYDHPITTG